MNTTYTPRYITVWEFRSVDGKQVTRGIRQQHPDDLKFQHEYQRIVYRGPADEYQRQTSI